MSIIIVIMVFDMRQSRSRFLLISFVAGDYVSLSGVFYREITARYGSWLLFIAFFRMPLTVWMVHSARSLNCG